MKWTIRERLMGDTIVRDLFPFQVSRTIIHPQSEYHPDDDLLAFCRETFGLGSHCTIMGTGHWMFDGSPRWIWQRGFLAFRSRAEMLVFLMKVA